VAAGSRECRPWVARLARHARRLAGAATLCACLTLCQAALALAAGTAVPALLWSRSGTATPQARALLAQLGGAQAYGLRPDDYGAAVLLDLEQQAARGAGSWTDFDARLSAAGLRFLSDLHSGRVNPRAAGFELERTGAPLDLTRVLAELAAGADPAAVIASVEPQFYHYRLLEQTLRHYRDLAALPLPLASLREGAQHTLQVGGAYAGAPALRQVLRALGDLRGEAGPQDAAATYDAGLAEAVQRFQGRHGLAPDGKLGKSTLAALTIPLAHRVRQIELTLERWRWLPAFERPPIIVNIPQFRLFAFRSTADRSADILQQDVIVGRTYPRMQTPVFTADMRYVVFRPYWDVPADITRREMLPQARAKPGFLASQHLEIVAGEDDSAVALPPTPANLEALAAGRLRLRQQPGPDNALGLIKFVLPNRYDVYLHATPAHGLFAQSRRAFSHGCIRVSDPVALAVQVLRDTPGNWTAESVSAAMTAPESRWVKLAAPVPVLILYGTVLALESGQVLFFDDIYGHDRRLEHLLRLAPA